MANQLSIYSQCNPRLVRLFEEARHPTKVICVAMDYAKSKHTALFCNGAGDLLKGAFPVENTAAGAMGLLREVRLHCQRGGIKPEHVFLGGEDYPSFAENFLRRLAAEFLIVRVNAWEAKQHRDNFQASTDSLDLLGIARCCLNRRAQIVQQLPAAYVNLRIAVRHRDLLVRQTTGVSNRMHNYVDRLFPGFLKHSGLEAFGEPCLDLMSDKFSPAEISRRSTQSLALWLKRRRVQKPDERARELKELAKATLPPADEQTALLQTTLRQLVSLYRGLQASVAMLDCELAYWLARTPGALLTSIGGIGVTLAAVVTAELGPPDQWRAVRRLCSYAGVIPRIKQTGGPDRQAITTHVQSRCNKRFKNAILQAVDKVCIWGSDDLRQTARKLEARGAHVEFAMAKRVVRLCKYLVATGTVYRPKPLLAAETPKESIATYYTELWTRLLKKWQSKADVKDVFAPEHPLGQWRDMARELYELKLSLPKLTRAKLTRH
jgi:transposase